MRRPKTQPGSSMDAQASIPLDEAAIAAEARAKALRDATGMRALARHIAAARRHPAALLEFVMKEETTRERLSVLPHQRVLFDFVMAHERCVIRLPVGFTKTYSMTALTLWLLGTDCTARGAVISAAVEQSGKIVGAVRDYIEQSRELRATYRHLIPSQREGDPWQQTKITVDRPFGIRDPSLTAVGIDGKLPGARLSWMLVDDILDRENTATAAGREKVRRFFSTTVLARRDSTGARLVVCNSPWHPDDLTYALQRLGWPVLEMDCDGNIRLFNTQWDTDDIRPSLRDSTGTNHRLTAHDAPAYAAMEGIAAAPGWKDEEDAIPLWPERFGSKVLLKLAEDYPSHEFNQLYRCIVRDEEGSRVKVAWIEACKALAREREAFTFTGAWKEPYPCYTGVDVGVGRKLTNDCSCIFTFAVLPGKLRRVLEVQTGRWSGKELVARIIATHARYGSIVRVETNGAQDFVRQWCLREDASVPVRAHNTGSANKHSRRHGVESLFVELENTAWLLPNDPLGRCPKEMQEAIDAALYYDPDKHTGDPLMAWWLAREQARDAGALAVDASELLPQKPGTLGPSAAAALTSR